ncbi:MAG: hypothetical protein AAF721_07550 [Myxococcota bacterium]
MKRIIFAGLMGLVVATSCDEEATDGTAVGTTGSQNGTTSSGATSASSSGAADESSGGPSGPPQCTRVCSFPGECCPAGAEGCPSTTYPFNFACVDDLCVPGGCESDEECGGLSCSEVAGIGTCVQPCGGDDDCAALGENFVCTGTDDAGASFCFEPCTAPGAGCGNSTCDEATGLCTCENSSQCIVGFECA